MSLTKPQRDALKDEDFAVPGKRKLPIHDKNHVSMAWDMVDKTKDLTDDERKEARARILRKAHELGISTKDWNTLNAMALEAMSLDVPVTEGHPNKMPFSGVLTKVGVLSDKPPQGSNGKRVMITKAAAEAALPSLLGMAVDLSEAFDDHDPQQKVGIITSADIVGEDFRIEGFIYAADFPEEADYIQEHCDELGFSYEVKRVQVTSLDEPTLTVVGMYFTGAAILKKRDAAYTTTSLSAHADAETDMPISKEEFDALMKPHADQMTALSAAMATITKKFEAAPISAGSVLSRVQKHSAALRSCADGMEAEGIGMHSTVGHVHLLRRMADNMEAEASRGSLPSYYNSGNDFHARGATPDLQATAEQAKKDREAELKPLLDGLAALQTGFADLKAKAFEKAPAPERKTLSPQLTSLLAKGGITLEAGSDKKLTVADVDKCLKDSGISDINARVNFKTQLAAAGYLAN